MRKDNGKMQVICQNDAKGFRILAGVADTLYFESICELKFGLTEEASESCYFRMKKRSAKIPLYYFAQKKLLKTVQFMQSVYIPSYVTKYKEQWVLFEEDNFVNQILKFIKPMKKYQTPEAVQKLTKLEDDLYFRQYRFDDIPAVFDRLNDILKKMNKKFISLVLLACCITGVWAKNTSVFLFTYFRDNGVAGVYLAASKDGCHFKTVNGGQPIMTPPQWKNQNLTRDPSIIYHDGLFRMVWTSNWTGSVFGYAESKDLLHWSVPVMVEPFSGVTDEQDLPDNVWAPEIHWDPRKKDYFIIYSSTTARERNDMDSSDNSGRNISQYDNRMYITSTRDGKTFTPGKLFFDQGFSTIDGVMRIDKPNKRWVFVVKVSRNPDLEVRPGRNLCLTFTGLDLDHPQFTPVSAPIAGTHSPMFSNPDPAKSMAEGQCLLHYDNKWWLYWDEPAGDGMQMATSVDLKTWTFIKDKSFPSKAQHGTIIVVPQKIVKHIVSIP